jgi:hypothetical protein
MTTTAEWLETARKNADVLRSLVHKYHPATQRKKDILRDAPAGPISAPMAEKACKGIREQIAKKDADKGDVVERFDAALKAGDVRALSSLISGAWFGLPESMSSRSVPGFGVACDLLDDPPEDLPDAPGEED